MDPTLCLRGFCWKAMLCPVSGAQGYRQNKSHQVKTGLLEVFVPDSTLCFDRHHCLILIQALD